MRPDSNCFESNHADELDPCLNNSPTSTTTTASVHKVCLDKRSGVIFKLDRSNCCIVALLLFVLLLITALLAFMIGQWTAQIQNDQSNASADLDFETLENSSEIVSTYAPSTDLIAFMALNANRTEVYIERLPLTLIPTQYDLHLNFTDYRALETAVGTVTVHLDCKSSTREVVFHASPSISLDSVDLRTEAGKGIEIATQKRDNRTHLVRLMAVDALLSENKYRLRMDFRATICRERSGVYCQRAISPMDGKNKSRPLIQTFTTKFEPALAKTLIPCWDEPSFKAIYNITLTYPADVVMETNTASFRQRLDKRTNLLTVYYHETPPMSSYLLSFALGPLVSVQRRTRRGLKMAIWTLPEDAANAEFASEFSVKMMDRMEKYFQVRYPMSKLDFVATRNFPVGGMENWGLVVFHHRMLLLDQSKSDNQTSALDLTADKFKISKIVSHELLHQWFGNLVTMKWWTELWLNEGFATYFVHHFMAERNDTDPDIHQASEYEHVLRLNECWEKQARSEKRPLIEPHFETESQLSKAFDQWNLYTKGCIMVKLMADLVGPYNLRVGMVRYLRSNSYALADRFSLWEAMGNVSLAGSSSIRIGGLMEDWLTNRGFPEVHVRRDYNTARVDVIQTTSDLNRHRVYLHLNQSHFDQYANQTWTVPFSYSTNARAINITRRIWVKGQTFAFHDSDIGAGHWFLANPGLVYPYRVLYDLKNWHLLIDQLYRNHSVIPVNSRIQMLIDAAFSMRDTPDIHVFVRLLGYLRFETKLEPLLFGLNEINRLVELYQATSVYPLLLVYFKPTVEKLDRLFSQENPSILWKIDENYQTKLLLLRCAMGLPSCHISKADLEHLLAHPTPNHTAMSAACQLYQTRDPNDSSTYTFMKLLGQLPKKSALFLHIAVCVRDKKVQQEVIRFIFQFKHAGWLASILAGGYTINHNLQFRLALWHALSQVKAADKQLLLRKTHLTRVILYCVRSTAELSAAEKVIKGYKTDKVVLRKQLHWQESYAAPKLQQWLIRNIKYN